MLFACSIVSTLINYKRLSDYFNHVVVYDPYELGHDESTIHQNQNNIQMENDHSLQPAPVYEAPSASNKVIIKAAITGGLILLMLIPTVFITNLVKEREQRQHEVVEEVSNKWAKAQTITGPYIVIPHVETYLTKENKKEVIRTNVVLLPEDLAVSGTLAPEERKRSIYTVLLYKTNLLAKGNSL